MEIFQAGIPQMFGLWTICLVVLLILMVIYLAGMFRVWSRFMECFGRLVLSIKTFQTGMFLLDTNLDVCLAKRWRSINPLGHGTWGVQNLHH